MTAIDLSKIELLVLDVDGVLTNGKIIYTPAGEEIKEFHVRDGSGMKFWRRAGKKLAIITGRGSPAVEYRAKELDVNACRIQVKEKLPAYREILAELNVSPQQTAVMGDDLMELPLMRHCAFPVAVADAVAEVRAAAAYVTQLPGGAGCVREVIEHILKHTGLWNQILSRYVAQGEQR